MSEWQPERPATLRAVIRHKIKDQYSGAEYERLITLDIDCPALENELRQGGMSEGGYHIPEIVGIELLPPPPGDK